MKRMVLVLLSSAVCAFAGAQVQFGVKAGYNLANVTISPAQSGFSSKSDFSAGILASVPLFSGCSLQPEVMYSGQGTSFSDTLTTGKLNYGYLNVPVLFKYQHASGLFAETGPQIGFLLSAKEKASGQTVDVKSSSQTTDFSWAFGVGYKIPKINIGVDARYNLGLTNQVKGAASSEGTVKNSVFQFGVFYLFGFHA
jgi:Outer membrane protein beta-barrel domain